MPERAKFLPASFQPLLAQHARLRFDAVRQCWIVQMPERVYFPDEIAASILRQCDGLRSIDDIVDALALEYRAARETIAADVGELIHDLQGKGLIQP